MKKGDRVKIREGITGDDYRSFLGFNDIMASNAGKVGTVTEVFERSTYPHAEVIVEDIRFTYLIEDLIEMPQYKPGDWVVLGVNGSGWGMDAKGLVVKIADIGPHLSGKMYKGFDHYDFFIERHDSYSKNPNLEQLMRSDGGGDSRNIKRFATSQEIAGMLDDVFKEYPIGSEVWYPRGRKQGVVTGRSKGIFYDAYPLLVQFDDGQMTFTSDGFPEISLRNNLATEEYKLRLMKKITQTPSDKKFELVFKPTS